MQAVCESEVIAATPYLYRYWTNDFYLISTNVIYNPVCIWHLPDEKEHAMEYFYHYYRRKKRFPEVKKAPVLQESDREAALELLYPAL